MLVQRSKLFFEQKHFQFFGNILDLIHPVEEFFGVRHLFQHFRGRFVESLYLLALISSEEGTVKGEKQRKREEGGEEGRRREESRENEKGGGRKEAEKRPRKEKKRTS
jgi:hypothetical protein